MMKDWLRRIRGAVGMGVTWAIAWSGVGALLGLISGVIMGSGPADFLPGLVMGGLSGFVGGGAFSMVLRLTEGRRTFDEMSLPRFALWGAIGGLLLFVLVTVALAGGFGMLTARALVGAGVMALMGAGSAAGSLALARRTGDVGQLEVDEAVAFLEAE